MHSRSPIIVVAGCTATGKSDLAIEIAKKVPNSYIVNGDSRQIYREIPIGTAQPITDIVDGKHWVIGGIEHHLFGHTSITENYDISRYQKEVQELFDRNPERVAIIVGGSGLYIDSVVFNYQLEGNQENVERYNELTRFSKAKLKSMLDSDILEAMNDSDRENPHRLARAIIRGISIDMRGMPLDHLYLVKSVPEEHEEIFKKRIDEMMNEGLIEENLMLRTLISKDPNNIKNVINTIGYREFDSYIAGNSTIEEVAETILINTRRYAKRQRTWFRRNENAIEVSDIDQAWENVSKFLATRNS